MVAEKLIKGGPDGLYLGDYVTEPDGSVTFEPSPQCLETVRRSREEYAKMWDTDNEKNAKRGFWTGVKALFT